MKNLLVLCAGSRMVNNQPLFLLQHPDGKLIAKKVIEGIYPEDYNRILYVVLEETDKDYGVENKIIRAIGNEYSVEVVRLKEKTSGPAETAYQAIKLANIEGEVAVRDSHSYIKLSENICGNYVAGLDLIQYEKTIDNLRSKSFIVLNEQKQVLDVVEKRFCSDVISGGLYGFKKASDFVMAYEKLCDPNYPIKKLYVSHIISYLIGYSRRIFHSAAIKEFEDWSTPSSWMRVQKKFATYFIDLDAVGGISIPLESEIVNILRQASINGCCFVGFTSSTELDVYGLSHYFDECGINVSQVVLGCTVSKIKKIINSQEQLNDALLEV